MKADFEAARLARRQCAYAPEVCDFAAIAVAGSPMDQRTRDQMATRLQHNLRAVPGKGDEVVRIDSVGFEGDSAFVTICGFDNIEIYDVGDPADPGDDILTDGRTVSAKVRWEMHAVEGHWLLFNGVELERLDEGNLCAP